MGGVLLFISCGVGGQNLKPSLSRRPPREMVTTTLVLPASLIRQVLTIVPQHLKRPPALFNSMVLKTGICMKKEVITSRNALQYDRHKYSGVLYVSAYQSTGYCGQGDGDYTKASVLNLTTYYSNTRAVSVEWKGRNGYIAVSEAQLITALRGFVSGNAGTPCPLSSTATKQVTGVHCPGRLLLATTTRFLPCSFA